MRYEDGPTTEVDVVIAAPLERVWALVTDINLPVAFSSELQGAEWLDEGPRIGARFIGRSWHKAMGDWETTCIVDRYEPMRTFGWCVTDVDNPSSSWWFELEPEAEGVRVTQGMRMGPAPSGLNIAISAMPEKEERIVARRLEEHAANMQATLEGIRQLAEGEP